ncbi:MULTISPECIES: isocitrate/isopropylmalate dehydrogenase family protein [unclassified Paenibacillus]|uniref:isocitrate/isopropylmalate dehydrogenase family protein n=1 Tax=unclassified Paenibacillus TaxID=185978 RepID=UPI001AEB8AC3|nr:MULTISPECIES: isocitrate/isopropylmalate dehydrogenase family protein [unclassified Paenibacillus]MBP1155863.1 3-isopropylmalate dehydrogenase [Paenibacillus sp. PvP091]MBP1168751.1 3-isopropylmalate dehydrogenase [Paenibacillus sp. PvR098]MBP2439779.1 3-isopropylmalate dehydrogenase [Paenibacillus sp. PvP052]
MGNYKLAILEGDGIGPEIVRETEKILTTVQREVDGISFEYQYFPVGLKSYEEHGATLPQITLDGLSQCDAALLGPLTTHTYDVSTPNMVNPSGALRKHFNLYANIRPAKNYPGVNSRYENVDLVIVRENTEGMYSDRNLFWGSGEFMPDPDTVLSIRKVTRNTSEKLAKVAFELAEVRRKSLSIVHKMNVLRKGCGLFYDSCKNIGSQYSEVSVNDFHVDAFSMFLVQRPEDFDVIVTTNMFGDILSDEAAGLVGGLGLAPGLNLGDHFMIAQATHGSAPDIAGKNIANPIAEILSAGMMLTWLGIRNQDQAITDASLLIEQSVTNVMTKQIFTPDLGGSATTQEMGDAIVNEIQRLVALKA